MWTKGGSHLADALVDMIFWASDSSPNHRGPVSSLPAKDCLGDYFDPTIMFRTMPLHGFLVFVCLFAGYFACLFLFVFPSFFFFDTLILNGTVGWIICLYPSYHYLSFKWKFAIHMPLLPNDLIHEKKKSTKNKNKKLKLGIWGTDFSLTQFPVFWKKLLFPKWVVILPLLRLKWC